MVRKVLLILALLLNQQVSLADSVRLVIQNVQRSRHV